MECVASFWIEVGLYPVFKGVYLLNSHEVTKKVFEFIFYVI